LERSWATEDSGGSNAAAGVEKADDGSAYHPNEKSRQAMMNITTCAARMAGQVAD